MNKINEARLIERLDKLAEFGVDPEGGWSRHSFTPAHLEAMEQVGKWMKEAGMTVRVDMGGNLIGTLPGTDPSLPTIAIGSHIDTVKCGGKYDGNLGVIAGLEAVQSLVENGLPHPHTVEVIAFLEEEGCVFSCSLFGSRVLTGLLTAKDLMEQTDLQGVPLTKRYKDALDIDVSKADEAIRKPGDYKCFLELHIEQSSQLDTTGNTIGVVQGIAGPHWFKIHITGQASHAGATPMHLRKDALVAASEIIQEVNRAAMSAGPTTVGTVGQVDIIPNGRTIIPGHVDMTVDVRDVDVAAREKAAQSIISFAETVCANHGLECVIEDVMDNPPVLSADYLKKMIAESSDEMGYSRMDLISGAAHDCQIMGGITDVAMIFVPSVNGLSHCPEEYTKPEDLAAGCQVLAGVLEKLQKQGS